MKTILILSYYFPPCNLTPSERVYSFARYFKELGYNPIIITRNWQLPIKNMKDEFKSTGTKVIIEKNEFFETHYLPYKSNLKDKLFDATTGTKFYFAYLILAFIYNFLENFSSIFCAYQNLYNYSKSYIKANKVDVMIISASPFHLFKFGFLINKKFNIPWIADYRDDWNTSKVKTSKLSIFKKIIQNISKKNEKKWVKSSMFFLSVSKHLVQVLEHFLKHPGYEIINGFLEENYAAQNVAVDDTLRISYVGSLYESQPIELFLNAIKSFISEYENLKIKIIFIGLKSQDLAYNRIQKQIAGFEKYFDFTDRISKKEAITLQQNSTYLLACAHENLKGIPGSKLYEYIALKKPVLIFPGDGDIIESTLAETGQGILIKDAKQLHKVLLEKPSIEIQHDKINNYARSHQVKIIADAIDAVL